MNDLKKKIVKFIEFCGEHPFATGLLALISVIGFALSILGFGLDRKESSESTNLSLEIQDAVNRLAENNPSKNLDYIQTMDVADTREKVIEALGSPDWRREYNYETPPDVLEAFVRNDLMIRIAFDKKETIENFCITTLTDDARYTTRDGFVIGEEKFADLVLFEFPMDATLDQSNWRGSYRYEESGFAPGIIRHSSKDCCFATHLIKDFNHERSVMEYLATFSSHNNTYYMSAPDAMVEPTFVKATETIAPTDSRNDSLGYIFKPQQFQDLHDKFRQEYGPDTWCSGGSNDFRDANPDLEKLFPGFQEYLRGQ